MVMSQHETLVLTAQGTSQKKNSSLMGYLPVHARIQKVGQGVQTPLKNYKNIGFRGNNGPDPLKITARFSVGP